MPDRINIDDLTIRTIVGIHAHERENPQEVLISLTLETDLRPAGRSDDIADAVNYQTIVEDAMALVEASRYFLIEHMAEEIARLCLRDERVDRVVVNVRKPGALRFARYVGVTIERSRPDV